MNKYKKHLASLAIGMLAVGSLLVGQVKADAVVANDTATIQITITPNVDRGVTIDTQTVNMVLGLVDLNVSTQTVSPATVTIQGNLTNTELDMSAEITGGWTFEPNPAASTADKIRTWVVFTATTVFAAPAKDGNTFDDTFDFLGSNTATFPGTRVGSDSGGAGTVNESFEDNSGNAFADMDALTPTARRHMWMYFTTPNVTSTSNHQNIRFYLTVKAGS